MPYEYTCAYLLGADGRRFLDKPLRDAVVGVLDGFSDPDADVIGSLPGKRDGHLSKTKKGHKFSTTFAGIVSELIYDREAFPRCHPPVVPTPRGAGSRPYRPGLG